MNAKQKGNRFERQVAKQINKKFDNANVQKNSIKWWYEF